MKIFPDCFRCFIRQANIAFSHAGIDEHSQIAILREITVRIGENDLTGSPAHVTTDIHRFIRDRVGYDPFGKIKSLYNQKALEMHHDLKRLIEESADPLFTASRLAIAGNIIDFGIYTSIDIEGTIKQSMSGGISVDDYDLFRRDMENANTVLYLLDNAGEIVFDKLLIETLQAFGINVRAVVKGAAVLNDATVDDAVQVGVDRICSITDNGSDCVGTILKWCSPEFNHAFSNAELVISKAQGNFETLMREDHKNMYFLFQAKCEVVSRYLGVDKGAMLLSRGTDNWK
jgi:uncharacterized protein with ATP-grasp and redox domains